MNRIHHLPPLGVKITFVLVILVFAFVGLGLMVERDSVPLPASEVQNVDRGEVANGLIPHTIVIPSIGVSASIVPVGVDPDGNMAVPEDLGEVGWYEPGFEPGQFGSAVFAGHVNSRFGLPTVFKNLENIQLGDIFNIVAETGEKLTFSVIAKNTYDFRNAPLEEIYGPQDVPTVNLITCDDDLWLGAEGTYRDRLVVTAVLIEPRDKKENDTIETQ
jgi:sortase A